LAFPPPARGAPLRAMLGEMQAAALELLLSHPYAAALFVAFALRRLGRRLYETHCAEEPELHFLPTHINRARPRLLAQRAARAAAVSRRGGGAAAARIACARGGVWALYAPRKNPAALFRCSVVPSR
jgi:hypothetical protein